MSTITIGLLARLQQLGRDLTARLGDDERGGLSAEYLGIIVVIVALVGALVGLMPTVASTLSEAMSTAIDRITNL